MHSLREEMEDLMWDMMAEQNFDLSDLEKRLKSRFPGNYHLVLAPRASQDLNVIPVRVVFEDAYDKTEWMMRWG